MSLSHPSLVRYLWPAYSRAMDDPLSAGSQQLRITIGGAASEWWEALHRHRDAGTMPPLLEPIACGSEGEIICAPSEWEPVRHWCETLPGWTEADGTEQLMAEDFVA